MTDKFLNGYRPFGIIAISVNLKYTKNGIQCSANTTFDAIYTTKFRQINLNTVIHVVGIDLYNKIEIIGH